MWDRGAPTPVVQNTHQAKHDNQSGPSWICESCGTLNPGSCTHCTKCSQLRVEERVVRQQARAMQGLGRGGGYYERDESSIDRSEEIIAEATGGLDVFGRRRGSAVPAPVSESAPSPRSGARNALTTNVANLPTKADRQKAALERLRNPVLKKKEMPPPRMRPVREKSSRSRSRDRKKDQRRGYIMGGGIC
mmetsp:Transcript_135112/g.320315  ORF Transcript_135112/g.320315 Transcript_135112/m.320315 type:complete len:191 (-) Transcript_135112:4-576(-)